MNRKIRFLSLLLCLLLAFQCCLCAFGEEVIPFSEMTYERPDMDAIQETLDYAIQMSKSRNVNRILDAVCDFYDAYDYFNTNYWLSYIYCSADLTDQYWQDEYAFCLSATADADNMLNELYFALAESPVRGKLEREFFGTGFFKSYDGENLWDDTLTDLSDRESALISQYYAAASTASEDELAQILVDLIRVRREIADYCGYGSYEEYANDSSYYRDYTPEQMDNYLALIQQELAPLYNQIWELCDGFQESDETETYAYVRKAAQAMGSTVWDAFQLMEAGGLYDIAESSTKMDVGFEIYLVSYLEPYVFLNPLMTTYDSLTFAHEFGHFCNDYASKGFQTGIDVSEIFSQTMEYLSLIYAEADEDLVIMKMADSLSTYVMQAMYTSFERLMYRIPPEELSIDALYDLYEQCILAYGLNSQGYDPTDFVWISHFFTNPMYICSYIISNDAAMQIYAMEQAEPGSGLNVYLKTLDTEEYYFLAFLESAGLADPFSPARFTAVREEFEEFFQEYL